VLSDRGTWLLGRRSGTRGRTSPFCTSMTSHTASRRFLQDASLTRGANLSAFLLKATRRRTKTETTTELMAVREHAMLKGKTKRVPARSHSAVHSSLLVVVTSTVLLHSATEAFFSIQTLSVSQSSATCVSQLVSSTAIEIFEAPSIPFSSLSPHHGFRRQRRLHFNNNTHNENQFIAEQHRKEEETRKVKIFRNSKDAGEDVSFGLSQRCLRNFFFGSLLIFLSSSWAFFVVFLCLPVPSTFSTSCQCFSSSSSSYQTYQTRGSSIWQEEEQRGRKEGGRERRGECFPRPLVSFFYLTNTRAVAYDNVRALPLIVFVEFRTFLKRGDGEERGSGLGASAASAFESHVQRRFTTWDIQSALRGLELMSSSQHSSFSRRLPSIFWLR